MLGEPLFFQLEVKNTGNEVVYLRAKKPGDCRNEYEFTLEKKGGGACNTVWKTECSAPPEPLDPGDFATQRWPLDFWFRIEHEGTYTVTVTHRTRVATEKAGVSDFTFSSTFDIHIVPADKQQVQTILQDFERDLHSDNLETRHNALDVMSTTAPAFFQDVALRLARQKDPLYVEHAIGALKRMRIADGWVALAEIVGREVHNQDELHLRAMAIEALGDSGDDGYLSTVTPYMQDPDKRVQLLTVISVAKLGKKSAVPQLQALLMSSDSGSRKNAARALRYVIDPDAVEALIGDLTDKDADVRGEVTKSLGELTGHSEAEPSASDLQNRWQAWWRTNAAKTHLFEGTWVPCRVP